MTKMRSSVLFPLPLEALSRFARALFRVSEQDNGSLGAGHDPWKSDTHRPNIVIWRLQALSMTA